jgi:heat shock protein HslJ
MKSKSKTILLFSFLSILLFSPTVYAQSKSLIGEWVLLSLTENGDNIPLSFTENRKNIPLVGNRTVEIKIFAELRLTKDSFSITPACNSKSGKYTIAKSGRLKFTRILTTLKGCSSETQEFDQRLVAALSKVVKYKIKDKVLTLQDAAGRNVLTFNYSSPRNQSQK